MKKIEKLLPEHIVGYLPYNIQVKYNGILNGKELGKWQKEHKNDDIFQSPRYPIPNVIYGDKIGIVKKLEVYKKYSMLRVGNGYKRIYFNEFGEQCFILLKAIKSLTPEELSQFSICFRLWYDKDNFDYNQMIYSDIEICHKLHVDYRGLIKGGLAVEKQ